MDDFEEVEGADDSAPPNSSTGPRNGTERNTNEVGSMRSARGFLEAARIARALR